MRISNINWGTDTGMTMVHVVLETAEEQAMDEKEIRRKLDPLFADAGIDWADVVDTFYSIANEEGELTSWRK